MILGRCDQDLAHSAADVGHDLARSVLAAIVQRARFLFHHTAAREEGQSATMPCGCSIRAPHGLNAVRVEEYTMSWPPGENASQPASTAIVRSLFVLILAYAAWYIVLALGFPLARIINCLLDDSFYYLQVARHVAAGHGSTFDGIEPTNGYHPLWMWMLVPVCAATQGDPEWSLRIALLVTGAVGVALLLQLCSVLVREAGPWSAALGLVLFAWPRFFWQTADLLESSLLLFLQFLLFSRLCADGEPGGRSRPFVTGLLLGLICLTRLDSVFLLLAWVGYAAWEAVRRPSNRGRLPSRDLISIGTTLIVVLVIVSPYLLWNLARFGHVVPIAGAMKSSFPRVSPHWAWLWTFPDFNLLLLLGAGFAASALRPSASRMVRTLGVFGLTAVFQMAYLVLFVDWGVDRWYFTPLIPVALVGLPWLTRGLVTALARRPRLAWAALALALLAGGAAQARALHVRDTRCLSATAELARWAGAHLPRGSVVAATDTGVFAWFSELTTINLDGVINNWRYRDALRSGRLHSYLRERGVGYILDQYSAKHPDWLAGTYVSRRVKIWYRPEHRIAGQIEVRRVDEVRRINVVASLAQGQPPEPNAIILWSYHGGADLAPR